jgi:hypothetical protein
MVRAGAGRWSPKAEAEFLAQLRATACWNSAAAAAGFSTTAIDYRRKRYPQFEAQCQAALEDARQRIPDMLAAAAIARLDPEAAAEDRQKRLPDVNVDQAIRISQMKPRSPEPGTGGEKPDWWEDSVVGCRHCGRRVPRVASNAEVREALTKALTAFGVRTHAQLTAEGWSEHEGQIIPPGWVPAHESGTFVGVEEGARDDGEA